MKGTSLSLWVSGVLLLGTSAAQAALPDEATIYKDPQCGCCDGYVRHLEEQGVNVTNVHDAELGKIKQQAGIPHGLGSCHTIAMGGYWIEGHVPMEAVKALFEERPEVDGIGLAGMPTGTPGMPGEQIAPYDIYSFSDQEHAPFMTLEP